MLITSTVEICIQQLGRVEEMVFTVRHSYASAVLGVVILSICHTRALWLIQRAYRRYFYTTWKGNPFSQMCFFIQLCSRWQDFNWLKASRCPSAIAELLVLSALCPPAPLKSLTFWRYKNQIIIIVLMYASSRQRLNYDDCLEDKREIIRAVLCCILYYSCAQLYPHTSSCS